MTQRDIKNMVANGAAKDLTAIYSSDERISSSDLKVLEISKGTYGMNAALFQHLETKELYAITSRNTALFYYV